MEPKMNAPPQLRGIVPPLVTPLRDDGTLDEAGLANVVDRAIGGGVHGLFVLGTTAEWASLDDVVRRRVVDVVAEAAAGRVPLYVHVTDTRLNASVALAHHARAAGASAVVAAAPYYLPLQQAELARYVELMLDRQPLPVVLYNIPQFTKTRYDPATVARLLANPRVIGIKDSSGDLQYQRDLIALARPRPDFAVLCGDERYMLEMVRAGAHGCVGGGANLLPRLLVALYRAAAAGDVAQSDQLQAELSRLAVLYDAPSVAGGIRNLKSALAQLGVIATDRLCDPYGGGGDNAGGPSVRRVLQTLGLAAEGNGHHRNGRTPAVASPTE